MSNIRIKDVLKFNNNFCILPFIHKYLDLNNNRRLCCVTDETVTEERLQSVRKNMLANKPVTDCKKCMAQEKQKYISHRQLETRDWLRKFPELCNNAIEQPEVYYYDLRYSNNCNLRCQMCGPYASSAWARFLGEEQTHTTWDPDTVEINPQAKKIYMAGGEPFMIKSFSRVLNSVENKDCEIVVNTNATIITNHMLDALKKFTTVCFVLSIDGTDETIESIRTGCNWEEIQKNIKILRQELNPSFMVNTVLQKDNLDNIPKLAQWIDGIDVIRWDAEILTHPEQFHFTNYSGTLKWSEDLWKFNCVKKNLQARNALRLIQSTLCF